MRGTIGGVPGDNLTPIDIVEMASAYGTWLSNKGNAPKVVVGRDGRISGQLVSDLVVNTLISLGIDVVDLGLSTTPTVEMAVPKLNAGGGIIFTASHNPKQWNALKLLNEKGEFISAEDGQTILTIAEERKFDYAQIDKLGKITQDDSMIDYHIDEVLRLPYVDVEKIRAANFSVVVDCINSTGTISIPPLLDKLNCKYHLINEEVTGDFAHNPEPVPKNLTQLSEAVKNQQADMGIAVDPDVDRLVFVCEDGSIFGEEYSLVAIADYVLKHKPGNTVSNLSSTRALADVAAKHGVEYHAAPVGEVNVVNKMKAVKATIGGEGNGGIILPDLHYGRDAIAGIALMLNHLVDTGKSLSELKKQYPQYSIIKSKIELDKDTNVAALIDKVKNKYLNERINENDGLKIDYDDGWVHLRESNTEPIIRVIAESTTVEKAETLAQTIIDLIHE